MTEYDYSPDAYEKFMEKQARVGRWAQQQSYQSQHYSNPFLPVPGIASSSTFYERPSTSDLRGGGGGLASPPRDPYPYSRDARSSSKTHLPAGSRSHSKGGSRSRARSPAMGHAAPTPAAAYDTVYGYGSPTFHGGRTHGHHTRPPPSKSQSYVIPPSRGTAPQHRSQFNRSTDQVHRVYQQQPQAYAAQGGQPLMYKYPNSSYVVIPDSRTRVEIRTSDPYAVSSHASQTLYSPTSGSPTKKGGSFFKRLFGIGAAPVTSRKSSFESSSSEETRRRGRPGHGQMNYYY